MGVRERERDRVVQFRKLWIDRSDRAGRSTISLVVNVASSVTPGRGDHEHGEGLGHWPYDPVSSDNSSSDPTTVQGADLAIHKSHSGTFTAAKAVLTHWS